MKTIQELYNEIMESQELKAQFLEAVQAGKQEEFLKAHGCEATLEEVKAFLEAKQQEDAPLSFDELENAAGGTCNYTTILESVTSIMTAGTVCGIMAAVSAGTGHVSQKKDDEGRLCTTNAKLQELYSEVMGSQELKAQFIEAANAGKQEEFLKAHGCEATLEQVQTFLEAKQKEDAPLSYAELENAAGGECTAKTGGESAVSVVTAGLGCLIWSVTSMAADKLGTGTLGQHEEGDGRLCNL